MENEKWNDWMPFMARIARLPSRQGSAPSGHSEAEADVRRIVEANEGRVLQVYWSLSPGVSVDVVDERMILIFETEGTYPIYTDDEEQDIRDGAAGEREDTLSLSPAHIALSISEDIDRTSTFFVTHLESLYRADHIRGGVDSLNKT